MPVSAPERILQRLDWQVIRRLDGLLQGDYRSLFYGYGLDLADLREYQPGDDIRYIDWNVTARLTTPYVRQYYEEREITAWFLLDLSPSIDFGPEQSQKRDGLVDFVAVLARLLTRHGNRVGAILYDTEVAGLIPPAAGRLHVLRMINDLMARPQQPAAPLTDLSVLLETALRVIRRRSLVFVVSDYICAPGWERSLRALNRRHEVIAVRLWDPLEQELPDLGLVPLQDAETGELLWVDTHDGRFRQRFREAAARRQSGWQAAFGQAGVDVLALSTGGDLVRAIVEFAARRKRKKGIAAPAAPQARRGL